MLAACFQRCRGVAGLVCAVSLACADDWIRVGIMATKGCDVTLRGGSKPHTVPAHGPGRRRPGMYYAGRAILYEHVD